MMNITILSIAYNTPRESRKNAVLTVRWNYFP